MQREQYLILVLFICWPYLRGGGGPNFSSFSLPCIRIIPQHLTLFEPRCVVASPASLCASDSPAGLWLSNHLGEREERLQSRRNKSTALLQDAFASKSLNVYLFIFFILNSKYAMYFFTMSAQWYIESALQHLNLDELRVKRGSASVTRQYKRATCRRRSEWCLIWKHWMIDALPSNGVQCSAAALWAVTYRNTAALHTDTLQNACIINHV